MKKIIIKVLIKVQSPKTGNWKFSSHFITKKSPSREIKKSFSFPRFISIYSPKQTQKHSKVSNLKTFSIQSHKKLDIKFTVY
jgi:hypothetical protein